MDIIRMTSCLRSILCVYSVFNLFIEGYSWLHKPCHQCNHDLFASKFEQSIFATMFCRSDVINSLVARYVNCLDATFFMFYSEVLNF